MKQLEELELKVLQIIEKNKELQVMNDLLLKEKEHLLPKNRQMEDSLMTKDKTSQDLENEKLVIRDSIKELLDSISSLEEKNKELVK